MMLRNEVEMIASKNILQFIYSQMLSLRSYRWLQRQVGFIVRQDIKTSYDGYGGCRSSVVFVDMQNFQFASTQKQLYQTKLSKWIATTDIISRKWEPVLELSTVDYYKCIN